MGILALLFIEFFFWSRKKKRIAGILLNTVSGIAVLYPASLLLAQAGVVLPVNLFTAFSSAALGAPGVLLLAGISFFGA